MFKRCLSPPLLKTDGRGLTARFNYDALNRVTRITYSDTSTETFTYDAGTNGLGRLTRVTDNTGATDYTYDQGGRTVNCPDFTLRLTGGLSL